MSAEAMTLKELAARLGNGVTVENLVGRIRRGSLTAFQDAAGLWRVSAAEVGRVEMAVHPCRSCEEPATHFLIVKYLHHERVEFPLCAACAQKAQPAYRRKGGVLEVVVYPLQGEGWLQQR